MSYFVDYHSHTLRSGDNNQTLEELCESAIQKGVKELCITEHVDYDPESFAFGLFSFEKEKQAIDKASKLFPELKLKIGAEIDYQRKYFLDIVDLVTSCDFDYIIGSCHRVDGMSACCETYFKDKTYEESYTRYFETVKEAICTNMFTTIGHFDWVKRYGCRIYGDFVLEPIKDIVAQCLSEMIKRDMTMELNAAGMIQGPKEFYPNIEILKLYREMGGVNITFASDTHKPENTSIYNVEIYDIIKKLGFENVAVYSKRVKSYKSL